MPVRLSLTEGTVADCTQAPALMGDLAAQYLLADRAYDTNAVVAEAETRGMEAVIHRDPTARNLGITTITSINCAI